MYTCANCGVSFEGNVCPHCCTMRPAAAVIGGSGSILRKRSDSALAPGQHAVSFAQELEYSRKLDAQRLEKERQEELKRRQREAELAAAREKRQKAESWKPKAPQFRAQADTEEQSVEVPEALRRLKIAPEKKTAEAPVVAKQEPEKTPQQKEKPKPTPRLTKWVMEIKNVPAVDKGGAMAQPATQPRAPGSERIDAAWRAFAKGKVVFQQDAAQSKKD